MLIAWNGLIVQLVLLLSIIDIYLSNQLLSCTCHLNELENPPAKRLVLFVCDGLRADTLWSVLKYRSGRVKDAALGGHGCHGEALSSVPSMSRSGVLAITAGLRINPVLGRINEIFGLGQWPLTIFNKTQSFFFYGIEDIYKLLKGDIKDHFYYVKDELLPKSLDNDKMLMWSLRDDILSSRTNKSMETRLNNSQTTFYFHLSSLERATLNFYQVPTSDYSLNSVEQLLKIIDGISDLIDNYYHDNGTAYVLCSDHGMSDRGTHGGGSRAELTTPVVAWGAGVAKSNTTFYLRQVDLAPFLSTLIGLPIPSASIGTLHLDMLNLTTDQQAKALFNNAVQLSAVSESIRQSVPSIWHPKINSNIQRLLKTSNVSLNESKCLIRESLRNIKKIERFHKNLVFICHIIILVGWGFICLTEIIPRINTHHILSVAQMSKLDQVNEKLQRYMSAIKKKKNRDNDSIEVAESYTINKVGGISENPSANNQSQVVQVSTVIASNSSKCFHLVVDILFLLLGCVAMFIQVYFNWPINYIIYLMMSIFILWVTMSSSVRWYQFVRQSKFIHWKEMVLYCALTLFICEFIYRCTMRDFPIGIGIGFVILVPRYLHVKSVNVVHLWYGSGALLVCFAAGNEPSRFEEVVSWLLYPGGSAVILATVTGIWFFGALACDMIVTMLLAILQVLALTCQLTGDYVSGRVMPLNNGHSGLPAFIPVFCWILLALTLLFPIVSLAYPLFWKKPLQEVRLFQIASALVTPVLLLSVGLEPLIYLLYVTLLFSWMHFETKRRSNHEWSTFVRLYLMFYFFAALAYINMGNMASVITFSMNWTRNFMVNADEELAFFLVVVKNLSALLVLSSVFTVIIQRLKLDWHQAVAVIMFMINLTMFRVACDLYASKDYTLVDDAILHPDKHKMFLTISRYCKIVLFSLLVTVSLITSKYFYRLDK